MRFFDILSCPKEARRKIPPEEYKIEDYDGYNDPIGVMCFLPPTCSSPAEGQLLQV